MLLFTTGRGLFKLLWLKVLCLCFGALPAAARQVDSIARQTDAFVAAPPPADTSRPVFREPIKRVQARGRESLTEFRMDRLAIRQDELLEQIKKNVYNAKAYLKRSIDTVDIVADLDRIQHWYTIAGEGVFTHRGPVQTHRNLATTTTILQDLLDKTMLRKQQVDRYQRDLMRYRNVIDSLVSDSTLYAFPSDSTQLMQYMLKLRSVGHELRPADSVLENTLPHVRALQLRVNELTNVLSTGLEEIEGYRLGVSARSFMQELPRLWQPATAHRPFREIVRFSQAKDSLSWQFYVQNNRSTIVVLLLLIVVTFLFLRSLKRKAAHLHLLQEDLAGQHLVRFPLLSAIVIIINVFQFMFPSPPFVFSSFLWTIGAISLSFVFRHGISPYWIRAWFLLLLFFLAACAVNFLLQASRTERWWMFFLSASGCALAIVHFIKGKRNELHERVLLFFMAFMALQELVATLANLYGWYNFSKTSLVSGFCGIMIAVQMLWTIRLIHEGLLLSSEVYKGTDRSSFYFNAERKGKKVPTIFYVFLAIGWAILFGRNFYVFRLLTDPVEAFLVQPRTIGTYSFSIGGVVAFFLILALSVIVSRIVSFFASERYASQSSSNEGKVGIGSWLLLVRIAIISIGLFLAFAAAGIPLDKVTLILGALGVGIGFGLQTLVNNLVSGLIIAFEKPVNVGDIVEVAGRGGTIQSIGFRSSLLAAWDGAVVVIPNGDLLNQHVVNWTQGNTLRRGDIVVGVAYGTDLEKAKEILNHILTTHEKVLKFPPPAVLITAFSPSAINFQVFFWLAHPRDLGTVTHDVISAIHSRFKAEGIEIPFPQQELHIRGPRSEVGGQKSDVGTKGNEATRQ